jgi:uncharacterized RDD family membrane protein YckC
MDTSDAMADHDARFTYASWGRRAIALVVDIALIVSCVVGLYAFAWALGGYDYENDTLSAAWGWVYVPVFVFGPPLYFSLMVGRYGATLGKLALDIGLRRSGSFGDVSYLRALGRVAAWAGLALFTLPLLLSVLWPLWDTRNQTLVDKIASTVVTRA